MPLGDRPPEPLDPSEVRALLAVCRDTGTLTAKRNLVMLTVMWRVGLRISEVLALRESDVNYGANTIRVLYGKGRKARTVGADDGVMRAIRDWEAARRAAGIGPGPLFCRTWQQPGEPLSPAYVRRVMKQIAERAGVNHRVHPHGLRHSMAVDSVREGIPVPYISRQLGHSSVGTTQNYLVGLYPQETIDAYKSRAWT